MSNVEERKASKDKTTGAFNYLDKNSASSLFRNSKVFTKRDQDGSDAGSVGVNTASKTLEIYDARSLRKSCELNGFELLDAPLTSTSLDFHDHHQVTRNYYPECEDLVRDSTGATAVFAFDHNIRSALGKSNKQRITDEQQVQGSALPSLVENDELGLSCSMMASLFKLYDPAAKNAANPLAWPLHANDEDLQDLPLHFISACQLDPLRDEGLTYPRKLLDAGVTASSRTINGVTHAADMSYRSAMPEVYSASVLDIKRFADSVCAIS